MRATVGCFLKLVRAPDPANQNDECNPTETIDHAGVAAPALVDRDARTVVAGVSAYLALNKSSAHRDSSFIAGSLYEGASLLVIQLVIIRSSFARSWFKVALTVGCKNESFIDICHPAEIQCLSTVCPS